MYSIRQLALAFKSLYLPYKAQQTQQQYTYALRDYILPDLGNLAPLSLTRDKVIAWHQSHGDHPYMANRSLAVLSRMYTWHFDTYNPTKGVPKFNEQSRTDSLTPAQLTSLGHAIAANPDKYFSAAILLLIFTGCRKNEVLGLKWSAVDTHHKFICLDKSKTGKRYVPLNDYALGILQSIYDPRNIYVIPSQRRPGKPRSNINDAWLRLTASLGFHIRIHGLRHVFASVTASQNESNFFIQQLLGHKDLRTSAKYVHMRMEPQREASNRVAEYLAACISPAFLRR